MTLVSKLIQWVGKLAIGQDLSLAVVLLQLILKTAPVNSMDELARLVYEKLPARWRFPEGPATEAEFVDLVSSGQTFLSKVKAAFKSV